MDYNHRRRHGEKERSHLTPKAILATFPNRPDPLSFFNGGRRNQFITSTNSIVNISVIFSGFLIKIKLHCKQVVICFITKVTFVIQIRKAYRNMQLCYAAKL